MHSTLPFRQLSHDNKLPVTIAECRDMMIKHRLNNDFVGLAFLQ